MTQIEACYELYGAVIKQSIIDYQKWERDKDSLEKEYDKLFRHRTNTHRFNDLAEQKQAYNSAKRYIFNVDGLELELALYGLDISIDSIRYEAKQPLIRTSRVLSRGSYRGEGIEG